MTIVKIFRKTYSNLKNQRFQKKIQITWNLPPAPAKIGDSRTAKWNGLGQVELDAVKPEDITSLCENAIQDIFDTDKYSDLKETEKEERKEYKSELVEYVRELNERDEDET